MRIATATASGKSRMHRTADDFAAEERIVMGKDRRVGSSIEPRQRPVSLMRGAGRIDYHLIPEDR
jgi:hypothetical protein